MKQKLLYKTKALVSYITLIDNIIILETLASVNIYFTERRIVLYKKYADARNEAGVTDYEVAKQTGVSTATLTNWKYGRYSPKIDKLKKLADYFGKPIEYFLE